MKNILALIVFAGITMLLGCSMTNRNNNFIKTSTSSGARASSENKLDVSIINSIQDLIPKLEIHLEDIDQAIAAKKSQRQPTTEEQRTLARRDMSSLQTQQKEYRNLLQSLRNAERQLDKLE